METDADSWTMSFEEQGTWVHHRTKYLGFWVLSGSTVKVHNIRSLGARHIPWRGLLHSHTKWYPAVLFESVLSMISTIIGHPAATQMLRFLMIKNPLIFYEQKDMMTTWYTEGGCYSSRGLWLCGIGVIKWGSMVDRSNVWLIWWRPGLEYKVWGASGWPIWTNTIAL